MSLNPSRYDLHDGSGLSAYDRVSAAAMVDFLRAMNTHPQGAAWRSTLAVSGESDGSLRHRLLDELCRGEIQAKTGTLNGVSTLAGYAKAASGKTYAFAILLNGPAFPSRAATRTRTESSGPSSSAGRGGRQPSSGRRRAVGGPAQRSTGSGNEHN
jgi:D-alanyl-D-alanine carboxypeptidase